MDGSRSEPRAATAPTAQLLVTVAVGAYSGSRDPALVCPAVNAWYPTLGHLTLSDPLGRCPSGVDKARAPLPDEDRRKGPDRNLRRPKAMAEALLVWGVLLAGAKPPPGPAAGAPE